MRGLSILYSALMFATAVPAADHVILVAGGGQSPSGVAAGQAKLTTPFGVDFDAHGNLFFVEMDGHRVGRIDPQGVLTTVAGTGRKGYSGDGGPATKAE